jgi:hypothetical protein
MWCFVGAGILRRFDLLRFAAAGLAGRAFWPPQAYLKI